MANTIKKEEKKEVNVIITTLSVLNKTGINIYADDEEKFVFFARQQQIPGTIYYMNKYRIDNILVIGTEETIKNNNEMINYHIKDQDRDRFGNCDIKEVDLFNKEEQKSNSVKLIDLNIDDVKTSYSLYLQELQNNINNKVTFNDDFNQWAESKIQEAENNKIDINNIKIDINNIEKEYENKYIFNIAENDGNKVQSNKDCEVQFIDQDILKIKNQINSFVQMVKERYGDIEIHFYIDVQGGFRTHSSMLNNILQSIRLFNNKVYIKDIISIDFKPKGIKLNKIKKEFHNVIASELIDAIKVFKTSCRTEDLENYFSYLDENNKLKIITNLKELSNSLLLGDTQGTIKALIDINNNQNIYRENIENNTLVRELDKDIMKAFQEDLIKEINESGILENGGQNVNWLKYVEWCYKKSFIQQALTIIESYMAEFIGEKAGITYTYQGNSNQIIDYCQKFFIVNKEPYMTDSNYLMNKIVNEKISSVMTNIEKNLRGGTNNNNDDLDLDINNIDYYGNDRDYGFVSTHIPHISSSSNCYDLYQYKMLKELKSADQDKRKNNLKNILKYNICNNVKRDNPSWSRYTTKVYFLSSNNNSNNLSNNLEVRIKDYLDNNILNNNNIVNNSNSVDYTHNGATFKYIETSDYNKILNVIINCLESHVNSNNSKKLQVLKTFSKISKIELNGNQEKKYAEEILKNYVNDNRRDVLNSLINGFTINEEPNIEYYSLFLIVWKNLKLLNTAFQINIEIADDSEKMKSLDDALALMASIKSERNSVNHAASNQNYRLNYDNIKRMIGLFIVACKGIEGTNVN